MKRGIKVPDKKSKKNSSVDRTRRNLVLALASAAGIGLILLLFVLAAGPGQEDLYTQQEPVEELDGDLDSEFKERPLSEEVKAYEPIVREELEKHDKEEYLGVVLALMMQESGGQGDDPMQASESLCGEVGCIDDPQLSIAHGVEHFAGIIEQTDGDVKLALQAYNFGGNFLEYIEENGGEYTEELAISFSQQMYEKLASKVNFRCIREISEEKNACYGDVKYVDAVLAYYPDAKEYLNGEIQLSLEN